MAFVGSVRWSKHCRAPAEGVGGGETVVGGNDGEFVGTVVGTKTNFFSTSTIFNFFLSFYI